VDVQHGPLRREKHRRPYSLSESIVLKWAKQEAALMRPSRVAVIDGDDIEAKRKRLVSRRSRFAEMYGEGEIDADRWADVKAETSTALEELDEAEAITTVEVPQEIDWEAPPDAIRAVLAALWREVRLDCVDGRLRPVEARWRVEWRAA
jgi:hypothetical protein